MVEEEERLQKEKEKEKDKKGETGLEKDIAKLGTAPSGNEEDDAPEPTALDHVPPPEDDAVVEDQKDPNSPLYSAHTFEELGLKPELLQGLYAMKYNKPSKIQEAALPIILGTPSKGMKPQHLIAQAQSGTGKTAAFTLGMLSVIDWNQKYPQAVCVCNTRELARQIADVCKQIGKFTPVEIVTVIPDVEIPAGKVTAQILIGTPGRYQDLMKRNAFDFKKIRIFVLDEADQMLDLQGLKEQTVRIVKAAPKDCQFLLFSATYRPQVAQFAETIVPKPHASIRLTVKQLSLDKITSFWIDCKSDPKRFEILEQIYENLSVGQSIVFVHKRELAKSLARQMKAAGHMIALIHGSDMASEERDKVIDDFRQGKAKVLISTNLLARGIDILQVSLVVNYDLPMKQDRKVDPETYLHRIGRTGRWSRKGIAINFVYDRKTKEDVQYLEKFFQRPIKELKEEELPNLDKIIKSL
jgi:ATP-dependent RNA helicase DDX19/DBP5